MRQDRALRETETGMCRGIAGHCYVVFLSTYKIMIYK